MTLNFVSNEEMNAKKKKYFVKNLKTSYRTEDGLSKINSQGSAYKKRGE